MILAFLLLASCSISAGDGKDLQQKPWIHIRLADGQHAFTIVQSKGGLDAAYATCKQWLKGHEHSKTGKPR